MGRAKAIATGPSHLARVLSNLKAQPQLPLFNIKSLRLSLAFRNDHFGARHFIKEQLPRIRYANPALDIQVERVRKAPEEAWRPEMEVLFGDGTVKVVDMHEKWSTNILKELMELGGGTPWKRWKQEAETTGIPVIPGEEKEPNLVQRPSLTLPSLKVFQATRPTRPPPSKQPAIDPTPEEPSSDKEAPMPLPPPRKSGARVLNF